MSDWFTLTRHAYMNSAERAEARCRYALPMSECKACGDARGYPAVEYPEVQAEKVFDMKTLATLVEMRWPKSDWARFVELRDRLAAHLPKGSFLAPGCGFGPMLAKVFKKFEGFGCAGRARLIASAYAVEQLADLGFKLKTHPLEVKQSGAGKGFKGFYVHAPMAGEIPPNSGITVCPECRRPSRPKVTDGDEVIVVASASKSEPVFRLSYAPHMLAFRQDFKEALVTKLGIKALSFPPLRTI